jgi:hypothetical protein
MELTNSGFLHELMVELWLNFLNPVVLLNSFDRIFDFKNGSIHVILFLFKQRIESNLPQLNIKEILENSFIVLHVVGRVYVKIGPALVFLSVLFFKGVLLGLPLSAL